MAGGFENPGPMMPGGFSQSGFPMEGGGFANPGLPMPNGFAGQGLGAPQGWGSGMQASAQVEGVGQLVWH